MKLLFSLFNGADHSRNEKNKKTLIQMNTSDTIHDAIFEFRDA